MKHAKRHEQVPPAWYSLDNSACIFPSLVSDHQTTVYRFSVKLHERIRVQEMNKALERIVQRFPYYNVCKKTGLFWYYYEDHPSEPHLEPDLGWPCQSGFLKERNHHPFRVACFTNTVAVEASHAITDGTGALTFIRALICEYFVQRGISIADYQGIPHPGQTPDEREFEDPFRTHYKKNIPHPPKTEPAWHIETPLDPKKIFRIIRGTVLTAEVLKKAKEHGATITEYLTAVYLEALQSLYLADKRRKKRSWVRVVVPINLRTLYQSITMRNFALYTPPGLDMRLGEYSFDEIVNLVHHFMKMNVGQKPLNMQISQNVSLQNNIFIRLAPVFIKNLVIPIVYSLMAEQNFSGCLTNIGTTTLPPEIEPLVRDFSFFAAPSKTYRSVCGLIGYHDSLNLSFGRTCVEPVVEREFFRTLVRHGHKVKIRVFEPGKEVF